MKQVTRFSLEGESTALIIKKMVKDSKFYP